MIVVTGGGGFIGSVIIWKLNEQGCSDIIVTDVERDTDKYKNLSSLKFAEYHDKDNFIEKIEKGIFDDRIDGIIHMGACTDTTESNKEYLMENNCEYTKRLAVWAVKENKRFVYASSAATYGNGKNGFSDDHSQLEKLQPLNLYGLSKHQFDLWAMKNNYLGSIAGLKYFNVFGPNEYHKGEMRSMVQKAFSQISSTGKMRLFKSNCSDYKDGEQMRDFIYVKDIARMTLFVYEHPEVNGIINIGTGKARSFNDLAAAVFDSMDRETNIEYFDIPDVLKSQYQNFTQADVNKVRKSGYQEEISSLEEGISDYIKNYLLKPDPYL